MCCTPPCPFEPVMANVGRIPDNCLERRAGHFLGPNREEVGRDVVRAGNEISRVAPALRIDVHTENELPRVRCSMLAQYVDGRAHERASPIAGI